MKTERQDRRQLRKEKRREWRVNPNNTPKGWKKVAKIAGIVAGISGALLVTIATGGIALPVGIITTLSLVTTAATTLSTSAILTKDNPDIDFYILQSDPIQIRWKDGKVEIVTPDMLTKLQKIYAYKMVLEGE